jgi:hypothetical protein
MRSDMYKIIVERPRRSKDLKARAVRFRNSLDGPSHLGMRVGYGYREINVMAQSVLDGFTQECLFSILIRSRRDNQSAFNQRAAASAVSSGRVLNAMAALGAALWAALTILSNKSRLFGGSRRPPPITTQS